MSGHMRRRDNAFPVWLPEELSKALNPEALARFFAVTIQGMRAMARLKSDRRALRQVARVALAALDAR